MVKRSVLLTVHDREPAVLMGTLRSLWRAGVGADEEVVIVDDRSCTDLTWARKYGELAFPNFKWIRLDDYECWTIDGFANPARAFNEALKAAEGEAVWIMSSDVLVNPALIERARKVDVNAMVWTPLVLDLETGRQYCGPTRLFPMPWFLVASRQHCLDVGGWDEAYLKGMCFEDNDFVGRLALKTGAFCGEWTVVCYHQSHDQPAYLVADPAVKEANDRNREWTMRKWGGIPFNSEYTPFDVVRELHESGVPVHRVIEKSGKLERVVQMTEGLHARV